MASIIIITTTGGSITSGSTGGRITSGSTTN